MPESTSTSVPKKRGLTSDSADDHAAKRPAPRRVNNSLSEALCQLLRDGTGSDLVLVCGGENLPAHSLLLESQCEFFAACLGSGMKESSERRIELKEENLDDVKRMLEYLYTGTFWEHDLGHKGKKDQRASEEIYNSFKNPSAERSDEQKQADPLIVCIRMYKLADKFGIPGLREEVWSKLEFYTSLRLAEAHESSIHVVDYGRTNRILGEWQRLMDAIEACFSDLGQLDSASVNEVADVLLEPLAAVAPNLLDPKASIRAHSGSFYLDMFRLPEGENRVFDDLQGRLERTPRLAARLFRLTCLESFRRDREAEYDDELMDKQYFNKDVKKMLKTVARLMTEPTEQARVLQCSSEGDHFREDGEPCSRSRVMVPTFGDLLPDTLVFRCPECEWEVTIDDIKEELDDA
ncbi:hypothetical protein BJ508DRAFT_381473 [Ascobolus immersus RN42]|uniref:BTB domain-containing protein n=1 Tax=Ascobolus immersus RN42 TaxID=1160509 RepID=A0A3N4HHS8_ASCIM|nr:hypothetical protein BJ508DRAFT_381473 [Ascobolus immersus RN42]